MLVVNAFVVVTVVPVVVCGFVAVVDFVVAVESMDLCVKQI